MQRGDERHNSHQDYRCGQEVGRRYDAAKMALNLLKSRGGWRKRAKTFWLVVAPDAPQPSARSRPLGLAVSAQDGRCTAPRVRDGRRSTGPIGNGPGLLFLTLQRLSGVETAGLV